MHQVEISISEFMKKTLLASLDTDFLAIMLLLARSADAAQFQNELIEQWESFNDLTQDQILVCTPRLPSQRSASAYVGDGATSRQIINHSLAIPYVKSESWHEKFASSVPRVTAGMGELLELYSTPQPTISELDAMRSAITASTTETAAFFGLGESMIPCLVFVALCERRIYAIQLPDSFSLYRFTRSLLREIEASLTAIRTAKSAIGDLENQISKCESQHRVGQGLHCYSSFSGRMKEVERIVDHLRYLHATFPKYKPAVNELLNWFDSGIFDQSVQIHELAKNLLVSLRADWFADGIPQNRFNGINGRLFHAIHGVQPSDTERDWFQAKQRERTEYEKRMEDMRSKRRELLHKCRQQLNSVQIGTQIERILTRDGFSRRTEHPRVLPRISDWSVVDFVKVEVRSTFQAGKPQFDYDVAISFAGADREIANGIAEKLRAKSMKVFFDKFEKYSLWGVNLMDYLTDVYYKRARYCLILISDHYVKGLWTNYERQAMQARAFESTREYILPVRLDSTPIPGVVPTTGYLNFATEGIDGIVSGVIAKCNASCASC